MKLTWKRGTAGNLWVTACGRWSICEGLYRGNTTRDGVVLDGAQGQGGGGEFATTREAKAAAEAHEAYLVDAVARRANWVANLAGNLFRARLATLTEGERRAVLTRAWHHERGLHMSSPTGCHPDCPACAAV